MIQVPIGDASLVKVKGWQAQTAQGTASAMRPDGATYSRRWSFDSAFAEAAPRGEARVPQDRAGGEPKDILADDRPPKEGDESVFSTEIETEDSTTLSQDEVILGEANPVKLAEVATSQSTESAGRNQTGEARETPAPSGHFASQHARVTSQVAQGVDPVLEKRTAGSSMVTFDVGERVVTDHTVATRALVSPANNVPREQTGAQPSNERSDGSATAPIDVQPRVEALDASAEADVAQTQGQTTGSATIKVTEQRDAPVVANSAPMVSQHAESARATKDTENKSALHQVSAETAVRTSPTSHAGLVQSANAERSQGAISSTSGTEDPSGASTPRSKFTVQDETASTLPPSERSTSETALDGVRTVGRHDGQSIAHSTDPDLRHGEAPSQTILDAGELKRVSGGGDPAPPAPPAGAAPRTVQSAGVNTTSPVAQASATTSEPSTRPLRSDSRGDRTRVSNETAQTAPTPSSAQMTAQSPAMPAPTFGRSMQTGAVAGAPFEDASRAFDMESGRVTPAGVFSSHAETSAPLRPGAFAPLGASDLPRHVAQQLASGIRAGGDKSADIILNPAELGRVRIALQTGDAGVVISVVAERPETLDLLRRHADLLAQEFHEIGYGAADFSFGHDASPQKQPEQTDPGEAKDRGPEATPAITSQQKTARPQQRISLDRVDIRL